MVERLLREIYNPREPSGDFHANDPPPLDAVERCGNFPASTKRGAEGSGVGGEPGQTEETRGHAEYAGCATRRRLTELLPAAIIGRVQLGIPPDSAIRPFRQ